MDQYTTELTRFDTGTFTLPDDIRMSNSVYTFSEGSPPSLLQAGLNSPDGHDYRSDFGWIITSGYNWIIADTSDVLAAQLEKQGKRNVSRLLADGATLKEGSQNRWYRRHIRDFSGAL